MIASKKASKAPRKGSALQSSSREAKQLATAILEVLAGVHTPTDAAKVLGIGVPRYYILEQRALEGLLKACEPRRTGRSHSPQRQIAALEKEVARLKRECTRHQSLVRAAQRTVGLSMPQPPKSPAKKTAKKKRKRRPVVRALKAVAAMQDAPAGPPAQAMVESPLPNEKETELPQEKHSATS